MQLARLLPWVLIPLLFLGCGDPSTEGWQEEDVPTTRSWSGVWGSSGEDIFVSGGTDDEAAMLHFDGASWTEMELPPTSSLLVWAFGFSPSDVWAVGKSGLVLHFDGSRWSAIEANTNEDLWGVWGPSPDEVYMVGGNVFSGEIIILRWDGSRIVEEELPPQENPLGVRALFKVWGIDGKVFAVGQTGLIIERTDAGWIRHPAGPEADDDLIALWGTSGDDIVAVGGRSNGLVSIWDGTAWTTSSPGIRGGLNAVYIADDEVLVGGMNGSIGTFNRETGAVDYELSPTLVDVHALWADPTGRSYAVGGTFFAPHGGVVMNK